MEYLDVEKLCGDTYYFFKKLEDKYGKLQLPYIDQFDVDEETELEVLTEYTDDLYQAGYEVSFKIRHCECCNRIICDATIYNKNESLYFTKTIKENKKENIENKTYVGKVSNMPTIDEIALWEKHNGKGSWPVKDNKNYEVAFCWNNIKEKEKKKE